MEAHSLGVGDSLYEAVEELAAVALTALVGVLALALQDGEERRPGLEESAALTDALESTAEECRPGAVTVGEQPAMVADRLRRTRACGANRCAIGKSVVLGLDRLGHLGHLEVRVGDGVIGDAGIGER